MMIFLLLILCLLPQFADAAAPTYGTANSSSSTDTDVTIAGFTVSGANPVLYVGCVVSTAGGGTMSGVTWNTSETFEQLADQHNEYSLRVSLWRLVNPTATTADIVATSVSGNAKACGAILLNGVNQTTPEQTPVIAYDPTALLPMTVTTATAADELVIDVAAWGGAVDGSVGANQTRRVEQLCGDSSSCIMTMSTQAGSDGGVMSWANPNYGDWMIVTVSTKPTSTTTLVRHRPVMLP